MMESWTFRVQTTISYKFPQETFYTTFTNNLFTLPASSYKLTAAILPISRFECLVVEFGQMLENLFYSMSHDVCKTLVGKKIFIQKQNK